MPIEAERIKAERIKAERIKKSIMLGGSTYLIKDKIGEGSFGVVKTAEKQGGKRKIVIKKVTRQQETQEKFEEMVHNEIAILTKCNQYYANIKKINKNGVSKVSIIQPYLGESLISLKQLSPELNLFPLSEYTNIFLQLGLSLQKLHQQNILHRDIKPDNVVYDRYKEKTAIIDYGLAIEKIVNAIAGTPLYTPRKLFEWRRPNFIGSDIHSFGISIANMLDLVEEKECQVEQKIFDYLELIPKETFLKNKNNHFYFKHLSKKCAENFWQALTLMADQNLRIQNSESKRFEFCLNAFYEAKLELLSKENKLEDLNQIYLNKFGVSHSELFSEVTMMLNSLHRKIVLLPEAKKDLKNNLKKVKNSLIDLRRTIKQQRLLNNKLNEEEKAHVIQDVTKKLQSILGEKSEQTGLYSINVKKTFFSRLKDFIERLLSQHHYLSPVNNYSTAGIVSLVKGRIKDFTIFQNKKVISQQKKSRQNNKRPVLN